MEYLLFRLYGPMASWGEIAVGEARHTAVKPSKSALIGLLGAALGIERDDAEQQQALIGSYHFAIKLVSSGQLLRDYHTAQAPDSVGKFRYQTRRDELIQGKDRLHTVLSSREYRTDAQALIAVRVVDQPRWRLDELADALRAPKFHLYLGRKSCPLSAPLCPQLVTSEGYRSALDGYAPGELLSDLPQWEPQSRWLAEDSQPHYFWEGEMNDFSEPDSCFQVSQVQQLKRHDQPVSRSRWQFQPRAEFYWLAAKEER
jgi:CRISPR system Cascade subunit CasD